MKILIVSPGRLPVPAIKGGAVESLIDLLIDYNEHCSKIDLYIAAVYDKNAEKVSRKYRYTHFYFVKMGKLFLYLSAKHLVPYRILDYWFTKKVVRLLKKQSNRFDSIVIQNEIVNGYVMQKQLEGNYIYHAHNNTLHVNNQWEKAFLQSCARVFAISDYLANCFKNTADLNNTLTIYNGIDTELFDRAAHKVKGEKLRKQFGIDSNEIVVVYAGRIVPEKGVEVLLKAFMMLPDTMNVTLLIIGSSFFDESKENSFIKRLRTLCSKKKEKIIFCGYVSHQDMPDYYSMADIGCVPSLWDEPFGLSVAEQMAMELPVITTDSGAIPEIVDSTCGFVLPRDDDLSKNIAAAILELKDDRQMQRNMGNAGRKIVCEHFSQRSYCEKWFDAIKVEE